MAYLTVHQEISVGRCLICHYSQLCKRIKQTWIKLLTFCSEHLTVAGQLTTVESCFLAANRPQKFGHMNAGSCVVVCVIFREKK